jgi:hypothetical protein
MTNENADNKKKGKDQLNDLSPTTETADPSFEMDEADINHPFTMVPNELIRNEKLSFKSRMLIIYLLSTFAYKAISIYQILDSLRGSLGRDEVKELLDEGSEKGYLIKICSPTGNLDSIITYRVSRQRRKLNG